MPTINAKIAEIKLFVKKSMGKVSFGFIAPNYNRPTILSLWCAGINRLRNELGTYIPAVVVSEESDKDICDFYQVFHITQENKPVTEKFNRGCAYMRELGIDYTIVSGSDNIFSTDCLKAMVSEMDKGYDLIGVNSIYFYATQGKHRGKLVHLHGTKMLGVGKCISKTVMDKINWRPWNKDKNWGMDWVATQNIAPYVKSEKILSFTKIFDCKSDQNINSANMWMQKLKEVDVNIFYDILSTHERELINQM